MLSKTALKAMSISSISLTPLKPIRVAIGARYPFITMMDRQDMWNVVILSNRKGFLMGVFFYSPFNLLSLSLVRVCPNRLLPNHFILPNTTSSVAALLMPHLLSNGDASTNVSPL